MSRIDRFSEMKRVTYTLLIIISVLLAAAITLHAQQAVSEEERTERGGWVESGARRPLYWENRAAPPPVSGFFTPYAPAVEIRTLVSAGDTLWIGTEGGLFAYSLSEDTVSAVPGPVCTSIRAIAFDDNGSLWVGGDCGISRRSEGSWQHVTAERYRFFGRVRDIVQGDERIWVATFGNGCAYIKDDSLTIYTLADSLLDDRVNAVLEEDPYTVWFGTESGLCRSDTLSWKSMRFGSRIPIGAVRDIILDEEGNLFLAVAHQGGVLYNLGRVRRFGPADGLPGRDISCFSLDPTGRVWAAGGSGVSTYDGSGWLPYRPPGVKLAMHRFMSVHHDLEGTTYLGTDSGSVFILSRDRVDEIILPQGFPSKTVAVVRRFEGVLWFLTQSSIYRLDGGMVEVSPPPEWHTGAMNDLYAAADGALWVATRFGILHFNDGSWELYDKRQGLPTEHFVTVYPGASGTLWFASFDRGVLRFTGRKWIHYTERDGLPDNRIISLVVDNSGFPWIVTPGGKVARFSGDGWEEAVLPVRSGSLPDSSAADLDSLMQLDPHIRFLPGLGSAAAGAEAGRSCALGLDARGNCIVARDDGVYRFVPTGWQVVDPPERRSGFQPTSVIGTTRGEIWVGTAGGGVFIRRSGEWIQVNASQGLTGDYIRTLCEDDSGVLWIGTQHGGITTFTRR